MIEPRTATALPAMHPGELLREEILPALGRPRVEIARLLGVSRQALHAVLAERAAVTPDMALPPRSTPSRRCRPPDQTRTGG